MAAINPASLNIAKPAVFPPITQSQAGNTGPVDAFQGLLDDATANLDKLQVAADASAAKLATGQPVELHEVMLETEKVSLAFQLVVQVRNKVVEAYQEVMRMQV